MRQPILEGASPAYSDCDLKPFTMKYIEAISEIYDRGERTGGKRYED